MGTRSLLAVETKPNKYYVQYMQFDGYPSVKGKEYYLAVLNSLSEDPNYFATESKPKRPFFQRIMHFLNNYQYASSHSINDHWKIDAKDWLNLNAGQEYQYLWDRYGNFIMECDFYRCTFPWVLSYNIAHIFGKHEHSKFISLFLNEDSNSWDGTLKPVFELTTKKTLFFPELGDEGWRTSGQINVNGQIINSIFTPTTNDVITKDKKTYEISFESEYLTVKNTPLKDLPLLIGRKFKTDITKELFEKQLKSGV